MEFVLRRSLETAQASLPGLHPENKHKMTDKPTAERILKAFSDISLTIIKHTAGEDILRRLTPLSGLQAERTYYVGSHPCQGYRKTSYNGWAWGLLSTGSLKFR